jgi:hypothetical protein
LSAIDGKIEQRVSIQFCVKLGKSSIETLEMLRQDFGGQSLRKQRFLNGLHVSWPIECMLRIMNVRGGQAPAKGRKMFKKFECSQ